MDHRNDFKYIMYPKTWQFNNQHSQVFSPYEQWSQEQLINEPQEYIPRPPPFGKIKYPDVQRNFHVYKYPYEIELDRKQEQKRREQREVEQIPYIGGQQFIEKRYQQPQTIQTQPTILHKNISKNLQENLGNIIQMFTQLIDIEIQCEEIRIDLCMQSDFCIQRLYNIFFSIPLNCKDYDGVTVEEFKKGLQGFGIQFHENEILLLMRKHQKMDFKKKRQDTFVDYYDFTNLFFPHSRENIFWNDMKDKNYKLKDQNFRRHTNFLLEKLLKLMLFQEQQAEKIRRNFQALSIDLEGLFNFLNQVQNDDDLSIQQLNRFFRDHGILYQDCDIKLFAFRITKRVYKEEIQLKEFIKEFTPKTVIKAEEEQQKKAKEQKKEEQIDEYLKKETQTSLFKKITKKDLII